MSACLTNFFEISESGAKCQTTYLESLAGAGIFHLGSVMKCAPIMDHRGNSTEAPPEGEQKDCLGKVRSCVMCVAPPSKTSLNCADVPGMGEEIRLRDSLVDFLNGSIAAPGASESFIRKVPKNLNGMSADAAESWPR